jgi:hypothetical protein
MNMKKWLTKIPWLASGIFIIAAAVFVAHKQHSAAEEYKRHRTEQCAAIRSSWAPEQQKSCTEEGSGLKDYLPWWYELFTWPEGITTWAIIGTGFVIAWQSNETRKAARATEDGAKASLLSAQALVNAERARMGFDVKEMGRSFHIDGKNVGKTAALITYAHGFSVELPTQEKLPPVPSYVNDSDDSSEWIGPEGIFDLLTGPDRYGFIADLSDTKLCERIRDKKSVLWVFGCIRYFDGVSTEKREKRFCFATSVEGDPLETYLFTAGPEEYRRET